MSIFYEILQEKVEDKPAINFLNEMALLNELNSCDVEYIVADVIPALETLILGGLVQNSSSEEEQLLASYEFGFTAVMVDFSKNTTYVENTWEDAEPIAVSSDELYLALKDWAVRLNKWKEA